MRIKESNECLLFCIYEEITGYYILSDINLEQFKEEEFMLDFIYAQWLIDMTNSLLEDNVFPKESIERLKKLVLKCQAYALKEEELDIIKAYDKVLDNIDKIDKFSFDILDINYEAKYETLSNLNTISGVDLKELYRSMSSDAIIISAIIDNTYNDKIETKYYLLTINKIIHLYSDTLEVPFFKKNIKNTLKQIINNTKDEKIKKEALKILKVVKMSEKGAFSIVEFNDFYYINLIIGLITNKSFHEYFSKLDEKEILHPVFIDSLNFVISSYKDMFDKKIANNLLEIVCYIQSHYKNYYSTNMTDNINEMKRTINSFKDSNNLRYVSANLGLKGKTKENLLLIAKVCMLGNCEVIARFNKLLPDILLEDINDIVEETLEDECFFSFILKSFMVSEEEFYNEYYDRLVFDDEFVKNIKKLRSVYPSIFTDDQVYRRCKKVIEEKINITTQTKRSKKVEIDVNNDIFFKELKPNRLLDYSSKREYQKVMKMINKYNVD